MQAGHKRLLHLYKKIPGHELAAMCVAGQLQIKAGIRGGWCATWLMRQQQAYARAGWRAGDGGKRVAAVRWIEMSGAIVGDPSHDGQRAVMLQHDMLVEQDGDAQPTQFGNPCVCAGLVFMVPGDEIAAVP